MCHLASLGMQELAMLLETVDLLSRAVLVRSADTRNFFELHPCPKDIAMNAVELQRLVHPSWHANLLG